MVRAGEARSGGDENETGRCLRATSERALGKELCYPGGTSRPRGSRSATVRPVSRGGKKIKTAPKQRLLTVLLRRSVGGMGQ